MYHAKHPEAARRPGYYTASGAFMGFGSDDESSETEDIERVGELFWCKKKYGIELIIFIGKSHTKIITTSKL